MFHTDLEASSKNSRFFDIISQNLKTAPKVNKQVINNEAGENEDSKLDDELNDLAEQKEGKDDLSNPSDDNEESESLDNNPTDSDPTTSDIGDDNSSEDKSEGKANRRSEVFNAMTYIHSTLNESIARLQRIATNDADIADCIAQLQSISDDMSFVTSHFTNYAADDAFIQLELFKKRIDLQMERLKRIEYKET